jgi:hypothetical protein
MRMATELRPVSEELFRSCLQAKELVIQENATPDADEAHTRFMMDVTGIRSGIDLENIPSQKEIKLLFYLVLEWDKSVHEICIEGPLPDLDQARNLGSFWRHIGRSYETRKQLSS